MWLIEAGTHLLLQKSSRASEPEQHIMLTVIFCRFLDSFDRQYSLEKNGVGGDRINILVQPEVTEPIQIVLPGGAECTLKLLYQAVAVSRKTPAVDQDGRVQEIKVREKGEGKGV
jgi:hypothetical protein